MSSFQNIVSVLILIKMEFSRECIYISKKIQDNIVRILLQAILKNKFYFYLYESTKLPINIVVYFSKRHDC